MSSGCTCRRCGGPDKRPGSKRRAALRRRLAEIHGNGVVCPCLWCGVLVGPAHVVGYLAVPAARKRLPVTLMELDRLSPGGSYGLYNLVPSCGPCNRARSNMIVCDWLATIRQSGALPVDVTR